MCGIAGMISKLYPVNDAVLKSMADTLLHRGPDDFGFHTESAGIVARGAPIHVGLAHRRLSIIDLSQDARQPMCNEDESLWIVFNGEIYNFPSLRKELADAGHIFKSGSDTEVLLHGYEEYGTGILRRLNGMFAFALWDAAAQTLFMARDRFGKKPLYYYPTAHGISFASELTALLKNPEIPREADLVSLGRYLLHEYVPAPRSMIRHVCKLEQAHALIWKAGSLETFRYWEPRFEPAALTFEEAGRKLRSTFIRAVERRLISDVPLGVFLSGGIDSSCVVAAMRECVEASRIQSFAIGFTEQSFDESAYAGETARHFGVRHREEILTVDRMAAILPEVWDFLDEPLADASIIPTYLLSGFARRHVTVALGGDGGDELFAGYDPFAALRAASLYERMPGLLKRVAERLANALPTSAKNMSLDFKIKQFLKGCRYDAPVRVQAWMAAFCPDGQRELLTPEAAQEALRIDPFEPVRLLAAESGLTHPVEAAIHYYMNWYLSGAVMTKVDRASMAVSLEARAPFLDVEVAELACTLPPPMKYHRGTRKRVLRAAFKGALPSGVLKRPKKGFGIPLTTWLKKDLLAAMRRAFEPERLRREGLFRPEAVQRLVSEHLSGKADHRKPLWTLLMFQNWRERVLRSV